MLRGGGYPLFLHTFLPCPQNGPGENVAYIAFKNPRHMQNLICLQQFLGFLEVKIKQGQIFCLPSRIPHSPQRPEARSSLGIVPLMRKNPVNLILKFIWQEGSLGLVVERRREGKALNFFMF